MITDINDIEIILIEDNHNEAELTIRSLEKHDLTSKLLWLRDGEEAHDFFSGTREYVGRDLDQNPKLILLDLKLPKIDGLEILESLKSNPKTKCIPVIILTSSDLDRDLKNCYELGANSYLVKPVRIEDFSEIARRIGIYWMETNRVL